MSLTIRLNAQKATAWTLARCGDPLVQVLLREHSDDPYAAYERMRAKGQVCHSPVGVHAVLSHELSAKLLKDPRFGVRKADGELTGKRDVSRLALHNLGDSLLLKDAPDHNRLRQLIAPYFRPKLMKAYTERVEQIANRLLDEAGDDFDLLADFAQPLPLRVIADLLGIDDDAHDELARLQEHGNVIALACDGVRSIAQLRDYEAARAELHALLRELLDRRREDPRDDMMTALVRAQDAGEITAGEAVVNGETLFLAGFETTANLIGNAVVTLLNNRDQWELLLDDRDLVPNAVDEVLRFEPSTHLSLRVAHEDVEIGGKLIKKDSEVVIVRAAANRDPEVFENPHQFDITRERKGHLTFAGGAHYCLGAMLAKMEAEAALRVLLERAPRLSLTGAVRWQRRSNLRALEALPVSTGLGPVSKSVRAIR
ncbi:cytochrome P450 [Amycolatopsis sp. NPDC059657]|uniref:cytochrome P450 n=1 Tax=Amycolatopsis sp. NPDC059657 TaxID=3346899 RepID=UPI00367317AE